LDISPSGEALRNGIVLLWGGKEWLMATFREDQIRSGGNRTRWLVIAAVVAVIVVAVVLVLVYSGGGGGGGGGGY
jgi:DMSO reductase anchor subunit